MHDYHIFGDRGNIAKVPPKSTGIKGCLGNMRIADLDWLSFNKQEQGLPLSATNIQAPFSFSCKRWNSLALMPPAHA